MRFRVHLWFESSKFKRQFKVTECILGDQEERKQRELYQLGVQKRIKQKNFLMQWFFSSGQDQSTHGLQCVGEKKKNPYQFLPTLWAGVWSIPRHPCCLSGSRTRLWAPWEQDGVPFLYPCSSHWHTNERSQENKCWMKGISLFNMSQMITIQWLWININNFFNNY